MAITHKEKLSNARRHAIARCYDPKNQSYRFYGGRGIKVCDRWLLPVEGQKNFEEDMGAPLDKNDFSLDRIDVDGDYTPENCQWVSWSEQARNRRSNIKVEYMGKLMNIGEAAKLAGLKRTTVTERIRVRGWTPEKALTTPVGMRG